MSDPISRLKENAELWSANDRYRELTKDLEQKLLASQASEAELRNQLAECQKDAERYCWLMQEGRHQEAIISDMAWNEVNKDDVDTAIDQAMSEKG